MLLVLASDAVEGVPYDEEILCISIITVNKLKKLGYQSVTLVSLPSQLKQTLENSTEELNQNIDRLNALLAGVLNNHHHTNFSTKAWRYMRGLWCYHFLCICNDRYFRLVHIRDNYPGISVMGVTLADRASIVPDTFLHFLKLMKDENYNALLLTELSNLLSLPIKKTAVVSLSDDLDKLAVIKKPSMGKKIKTKVVLLLYKILMQRAKIILLVPYLPKNVLIKFFIYSFGRILVSPRLEDSAHFFSPLDKSRKEWPVDLLTSDSSFNEVIKKLAPLLFPMLFLERFDLYVKTRAKLFCKSNKIIFTANGWYDDCQFKLLAAYFHDSGQQVWGVPHGGGGSFLRRFWSYAYHEVVLTDRYYIPGNFAKRFAQHIQKISTPMIFYIENNFKKNIKKGIADYFLYGLTSSPAYTNDFDFFIEDYIDYMGFARRFFLALNQDIQQKLLVRTHHEERWWELNNYIKSISKDIKFDSWDRSFHQSLSASILYICDHISTTYVEALIVNKPMVLFFDVKQARINQEALPFLMQLKEVGMYHETPESAAAHIEKIQFDVDDWWFSKEVQEAKKEFSDNFAYSSPIAFKQWLDVFKSAYKNVD